MESLQVALKTSQFLSKLHSKPYSFFEFTDKDPSMAPSAVTFVLSHPLIQQITRNNTLQPQREPSSKIVKCLLPAINSSESSDHSRSKFSLWLFGDPATYDQRFQEAIELNCS
uniref:Uncharacterized protein n=1 Tax=Noccaea caerulescens TaxID=107243 RepID=A0A1J3FDI1_NOCCA